MMSEHVFVSLLYNCFFTGGKVDWWVRGPSSSPLCALRPPTTRTLRQEVEDGPGSHWQTPESPQLTLQPTKKMLVAPLGLVAIMVSLLVLSEGGRVVREAPPRVISASSLPECVKITRQCLRNSECCSGCCQDEKCVESTDTCTKAQSPCSYHECPNGKECYLHQVQCLQAPCPPIPACRSVDYADYSDE